MIAISYRREDSLPIAGRLYDRLQAKFGKGNVFMDFDSISPGTDFRREIRQTIERAKIIVVVIGPHWLGASRGHSRRIDNPADFVRLEVEYALQRDIPIIPLLVNDTPMPEAETLPAEIKDLAFRNALPLDSGIDFHNHVDRLVTGIVRLIGAPPKSQASFRRRIFLFALVPFALLAIGVFCAYFYRANRVNSSPEVRPGPRASASPEPQAPPLAADSSSPEPWPADKKITDGHFLLQSKATGLFLSLRRKPGTDDWLVVQAQYNRNERQTWMAVPAEEGQFYYLVPPRSTQVASPADELFLKKRGRRFQLSLDDVDASVQNDKEFLELTATSSPVREADLSECLEIKRGGAFDTIALGKVRTPATSDQEWVLDEVEPGYYGIMSRFNSKSIDVPDAKTTDGLILILYGTHRGNNQLWQLQQPSGWSK